jgi:enterochelin esterase-like enzyme
VPKRKKENPTNVQELQKLAQVVLGYLSSYKPSSHPKECRVLLGASDSCL